MTFTMHNVEGIPGFPEAELLDTPVQIPLTIERGEIFTSCGDNGAMNIWRGNDGHYYCKFMRWQVDVSSIRCSDYAIVRQFAIDGWPMMGRTPQEDE